MAYDRTKLNNIAGSMGLMNIWLYVDTTDVIADLDADDWFAGANADGMRVGDLMFIQGSDGVAFGYMEVISKTASQLTALTDAAH